MVNDLTKTVFGRKLNKTYKLADVLSMLDEMNLLQCGELAEQAISKKSGVSQCTKNTPAIDLVTGVQIKHARTHFNKERPHVQKAYIGIKGTTAPILAVVTEQVTGKQFFLNIPYKARRHLNGNTIAVQFDKDGNPNPSQWWEHKVDSFADLCKLAKKSSSKKSKS